MDRPRRPGRATARRPRLRAAPAPRPAADYRRRRQDATPTLFDEPDAEPAPARRATARRRSRGRRRRCSSPPPTRRRRRSPGGCRSPTTRSAGCSTRCWRAPGHRLVPAQAATALAVSPVVLRGAILHAQRLLNVEGYPVLRVDADGAHRHP